MPDLVCVCDLHYSPRQCWILNPLRQARDQTRILMDPSCVVTAEPQQELLSIYILDAFSSVIMFFSFYLRWEDWNGAGVGLGRQCPQALARMDFPLVL